MGAAEGCGLTFSVYSIPYILQRFRIHDRARDANGRFISQADADAGAEAVRLAELERQYKMGELTMVDFVRLSGVVDTINAERQQESESYQSGWEKGTKAF